ncbi:hypothetical protein MAPG_03924 [Magnaporthiopsis poae ATCC 64411]|uniref:Uncharacterized protein n=1 Tax=Magnaporthiopsis poae (strain ATCC 64411 / 73-15) TaxID=644358 RepID=A0A0C4DVC2_MAGP6|nr:hypothetical protein MAPG_03924 [Magnaporthiopsis poae ATCC 64411]
MDQDYDIEMGDVEDYAMPEADSILPVDDDILPADDAEEPGEVAESTDPAADLAGEDLKLCPAKVHIRGLDNMNPNEIKAYFDEHAGGLQYKHIEWIDDSSANLVFASESSASEALIALSAIDVADTAQLPVLELLPAKPCGAKPGTTLQERLSAAARDNRAKELFPSKVAAVGGKAQMDQIDEVEAVSRRLSDRITRPGIATGASTAAGGTSIKGLAKQLQQQPQQGDCGTTGFSIKGRATARELFPDKLGNAGKELFADKLEGRGRPRRKAEDSFY